MVVVRWIGAGGLGSGHYKLLSRKRAKAAEQRKTADFQKMQSSQPQSAR
jgi:hypothetical protein